MAFSYQTYNLSVNTLIQWCLLSLIVSSYGQQFPPKLLPQQSIDDNRRIIKTGSSIALHCPVEKSPNDDIYYEWLKDGKPVEYFDDRIRMTNNGVLKIRHSVSEDTGRFMCKAINGFGSVEFTVILIVLDEDYDDSIAEKDQIKTIHELDSAVITSKPEESGSKPQLIQVSKFPQRVIQKLTKSGIRFKCVVSGNPKPTITWFHNNDQLTDSESKKGRFSLVINDLKPEDSGNYTCLVSNPFGTVAHSYILDVIDQYRNKPELQGSHPMNTTVISGSTATFQCSIKSDEVLHIQWLKKLDMTSDNDYESNNLNFGADEQRLIEVQGESFKTLQSTEAIQSSEGIFFNKLVIINVKEADAGKYLCLGANTIGSSFRSAFLSVLPKKQQTSNHFYSISKQDIFPIPIVIALVSVAIIIIIAIMIWIFLCYCQKQEPNTRTNQPSYHSPSKHSRSSVPSEQNITYNQVVNNKYHNIPSNDLRASSPFYSELITSDKRASNVYQLYSNAADIKPNQSHKPYGYLC